MNARLTLALVLALGGCATARPAATTTAAHDARAEVSAARDAERETARARAERIRELEAQLALAHAEARALRAELRSLEASARRETTRIVHAEPAPIPDEAPPSSEPRPVLRLYGAPPQPAPVVAGPPAPIVADAPPLPSLRLPVAHAPGTDPARGVPRIPETPIVVAPPAPPAEARPRDDGAVRAYREGLEHVSARRFEQALAAFDAFLDAHPDHPYAGNAMYWRGEIHYARRDYRRALAELSRVVERYPGGSKVPEALLRIGLCHARMGEPDRAQRTFERLRAQFPGSVAAQMAAREDV